MNYGHAHLRTVLCALVLLPLVAACGSQTGAAPETAADTPSPAPIASADLASPDVYEVIAENDAARLLMATWKPGQSDEMHSHPELISYLLTDGSLQLELDGGKVVEAQGEAGMVHTQPPVVGHKVANTGDQELKILLLERKSGAAGQAGEGAAPPSYEASPDHYQVVEENEWARVVKVTWQPGDKDAQHSHPDSLVYVLTDGHFELETADGQTKEIPVPAGAAAANPALLSHSAKNISDREMQILMFELK